MLLKAKVAVLYHIFYEDTFDDIITELENFNFSGTSFLFNISAANPKQTEIRRALIKKFPDSVFTTSSDKGKDIGGKLILINTCIQAGISPDWFIFLHDKKSLQALNAKTWKNDLLKIIEHDHVKAIADIIANNPRCGIISVKKYIIKEVMNNGEFAGNNAEILVQLLLKHQLSCDRYEYVAGTMFWGKAAPLIEFFKKYDPLEIRQTLESGNVIDNFGPTYTHAWERLLSWIIISKGFTIESI